MDLAASEEELQGVEAAIQALNGSAEIIRTQRCKVPLDSLLGRGCFSPSARVSDAGGAHGGHVHDAGVGSVCLRLAEPVCLDR